MLPEDWDCFIEDILSGEQFSSSHCNIIGQFNRRLANKGLNGPLLQREKDCPGGPMAPSRKQQVIDLLKSLETKDPVPLAYVNPNKYIQHNLQVGPGPAGVAALIKNMPPDASVNTIRVFEDGDYVFAHTQYNFFGPRIGFDIFRYEDSLIVEHWDNLQETATEPSPSGHTMIDGPTIASDLDKTDANKALMQRYMEDLLAGRRETFPRYFNGTQYIQHNPWVADTIPGLIAGLQALAAKGQAVVYKSVHKILGEGNFVLVVAEATFGGVPTGIYDLFRIEKGRIAEHWDTLEAIPPRDQWKNSNGKF
jgi:predicted SnoaL-like aldol condensation-catalyzing enzyme